jgi:hypothetical protein
MRIDGACHCGAIKFEADVDPDRVRICHCSDCQKLSGSSFRVVAPCSEKDFHLLQGQPKIYVKVAESGARRVQAFCGDCGSPLYATSEGGSDRTFGIRVGVVTQREALVPKRQFWHRSALPWLPDLPGVVAETQ